MVGRAYDPLTREHLDRLVELAEQDRVGLFARRKHLAPFADRILSVALCQGGALHYVDGRNGIKDLDVWTLYAALPRVTYPYRRRGTLDDCDMPGLVGWARHIDFLGRSLPFKVGTDPASVWRSYLSQPKSRTASLLADKAVVLLVPKSRRGEVVWGSQDVGHIRRTK
jgi:hypothetical protein